MGEIKFRNLRKDEVEVRRGRKVGQDKVELLVFKTSRTDMALLDETVGTENWVVQYKREGDTLLCGIGIYSEKHKAFLYKWAAGSETSFEATKGEQSDALKRSGFVWNIGRSLYTAPRIVVKPENDWTQYYVDEIGYDDKDRINNLRIIDDKGNTVFNYVDGKQVRVQESSSVDNVEVLRMVCSELKKDEDVDRKQLLKFYNYYEGRIGAFNNVSAAVIRKLWNKWLERV